MAATKKKDEKLTPGAFMKLLAEKENGKGGAQLFVYGSEAGENFFKPRFHIPTGNTLLDTIIGEGGLGTGRISEFYGPNRSGKSEAAQKTVCSFLEHFEDGLAWYFDQELAIDEKKLNARPILKSDRLTIGYVDSIQKLFAKIEKLATAVKESKFDVPMLIVVDSIAMMEADAQLKKEIGAVQQPGAAAKAISECLKRIKPIIQATNIHLLIVNQIRKTIGDQAYGEDESPMGEALKFACDYRISFRQQGQFWFRSADKDAKMPSDGFFVRAYTIKNKRVPPNREAVMVILYHPTRGGLSDAWSLFEMLKKAEIMNKSGNGYSLRHGPHKTDDLLKFTRSEWPQVFEQERAKVMVPFRKWESRIMLMDDALIAPNLAEGEEDDESATGNEQDSDAE